MKYLIITMSLFFLSGCDYLAPQVEKSKTEKRQELLMERQAIALERIADKCQ